MSPIDFDATSPAPVGFSAYAQLEGSTEVKLVPSILQTGMKREVKDLRDKTIVDLKPEQIVGVAIEVGGVKTDLARSGADDWKATTPAALAVDAAKVKSLVGGFSAPKAASFAADAQRASLAKPAATLTLRLKDKSVVTLKFGALKDQDYPVQKVGAPETYIIKKFSAERFLKKPDDFKRTATAPAGAPRPAAPMPPVKVNHRGVEKGPPGIKLPGPAKAVAK